MQHKSDALGENVFLKEVIDDLKQMSEHFIDDAFQWGLFDVEVDREGGSESVLGRARSLGASWVHDYLLECM